MKQVVLIMVDTQRQDMLSCYNKKFIQTPALDSIAESGTQFQQGYTCQPVCGPARSAIFTGIFPHGNGMVANSMQLGANTKTAGQYLKPNGIECAFVGKWHLDGGDYFGYGKCPDGYNPKYWYDMRNFIDELPSDKERRKSRVNMGARFDDPKEENTYAHRCCDRAIKFLDEYRDKDFFLTLSLDEPHDPSVCPRRFVVKAFKEQRKFKKPKNYYASLKDKPEHQKVWSESFKKTPFFAYRLALSRNFLPCNSFCDYEIGRVLDHVKELGLEPMIIYTSDHGDMMTSHGLTNKGCVMYNEVTRIPFLISGGGFGTGVKEETPVSHIDLLPTIMKYFDVHIPAVLQGEPLQNIEHNARRDVFTEYTRYEVDHDGFMGFQPIRCIFDGRYKLVINLLTTDEFYDLEKDPYEMKNLIWDPEYAEIRDKAHDRLIHQMDVTRDVYRGYYWLCRPWRKGENIKPSMKNSGYERRMPEEDFRQLNYSTGLPFEGNDIKR